MAGSHHASSEIEWEGETAPIYAGDSPKGLDSLSGVLHAVPSQDARRQHFFEKLKTVMQEVDRIGKDKHNQQGNYKYASEAAIKERFHPLFASLGLVLVPSGVRDMQVIPPSGDKKSYLTAFIQCFRLMCLDSGSSIHIEVPSCGGDSLDKGAWKALTGAIKYTLTTMFLIPTGDDPEADGVKPPRTTPQARKADPDSVISVQQAQRLHAIVTSNKIDTAHAKDVLKRFGYESSKQIKVRDYDAICMELTKV